MLESKTILNQFHFFNQHVLKKGALELYAIDQVFADDETIFAVMQYSNFSPSLYLEDDKITSMECDCQTAGYCEHLASLLLHLYKNQNNPQNNPKPNESDQEPKPKPEINHGFVNDFRKIQNPDALLFVDKADMFFYSRDPDEFVITILSDNNDQLKFLIEEEDEDIIGNKEDIQVEMQWIDEALYISCDSCSYTSDSLCFHQKFVFIQDFWQVREFLDHNLNIETIYSEFEKFESFPPSLLQEYFYISFVQNDVYLSAKSHIELVNGALIDDLERRLQPFEGNSDEQNSLLSDIYKEEETTTGNAVLWANNDEVVFAGYLEGRLSHNRKKLTSHIKWTNQPDSIPFSIQYDLKKLNLKLPHHQYGRRDLHIQKQLKFLQKNTDRFNQYIHYLYLRMYDSYYHKISKKDLHHFSFAEHPFTLRFKTETEQGILRVRLSSPLLKTNNDHAIIEDFPFFLVIDKKAYVYRNTAVQQIIDSPDHEIKYLFDAQDIDSMRRGISRIVNYFDINISDLDEAWVKTVPARKRVIQLSQSGSRIGFSPLLEDLSAQNTFNILIEQCLPASEEPFMVHIPEPKRRAEFLRWFEDLHPQLDWFTEPLGFYTLPGSEFVNNNWFLDFSELCEKEGIEVRGWDSLQCFSFNPFRGEIEQGVSDGADWFDLNFVIRYGDLVVPQKDWIRAVRKGERSILLKDGSYGIIPEEWRLRMIRLLHSAEVSKDKIQLSKLHFNALEQYVDLSNNPEIEREIENKKARLIHFKGMKTFDLPDSIKAELRSYQKEGYQWLKFLNEYGFGGCLADDMGLGKTLQVLTLMADQMGQGHPASLVVVPRSLVHNWVDEIEKFCPEMKYYIHHGPQRSNNTKEFTSYDLVISTYGTISNDINWIRNYNFHYIILDESQAIKNPDSLRYKSLIQLTARHKLTMTGTPIENSTMDLFAQFNFINPGLLGNKNQFRKRFSDPIEKEGDADVKDLLQKIIHPFLLRRTKTQVTKELPPKTETILYCEMEDKQKSIYHKVKNEIRASLLADDQLEKNKMKVLDGLLKLRQICNSPALLPENGIKHSGKNPSVKIDILMEQIREVVTEENHSILVFSQFTSMLALVRKRLDEEQLPYAYLDGSTTNRKAVIDEFNTDDRKNIFLLSLKAGNVGLNLTKADFVYLLDPWWNPAVESQAIDRTHRIGQTKPVFAYRLICKDTIEEKIIKLQSKKNKLAKDLIQTDENVFKSLDRSELIRLFE